MPYLPYLPLLPHTPWSRLPPGTTLIESERFQRGSF
jgi:hypothetical protein